MVGLRAKPGPCILKRDCDLKAVPRVAGEPFVVNAKGSIFLWQRKDRDILVQDHLPRGEIQPLDQNGPNALLRLGQTFVWARKTFS